MSKIDAVAVGELLIDFTPAGKSELGNPQFAQNPGGAPANVMAGLAKWGFKTSFIGKVGDDGFGRFLADVLVREGIDAGSLILTKEAPTTLAFVQLKEDGDRSFQFYRNPGADMLLRQDEIDPSVISSSRLFHYGSVSMTHEPSASATLFAASLAKEQGLIVSYDPNLRPLLWPDLETAKTRILEGFRYCDVVKLSEEELEFLTGESDLERGSDLLYKEYGNPLIFVTLGPNGSFYRLGDKTGSQAGFKVNAVDTTGAGDAFFAGVLYQLLQSGKRPAEITLEEAGRLALFGNASGALTTTGKGAIPSLPTLEDIDRLIKGN